MSISPDFTEAGRFSGRGGLEKSNFSQTCSLLSQYLKENGSFGDLSLGINRSNVEETFRQTTPIRTVKSMDLFPQHSGFGTDAIAASVPADFSSSETESAQMTIFYAGKVHVFDNFSTEKAKELMILASKAGERSNINQELPRRIVSDLPIARKASLHRFLEKRKDRINSRATYQIKQSLNLLNSALIHEKNLVPVENKTWLGLTPQSINPFKLHF